MAQCCLLTSDPADDEAAVLQLADRDVDPHDAHGLGREHDVPPFVAHVEVEVGHARRLVRARIRDEGLPSLGALDLDVVPRHTEAARDARALEESADERSLLVLEALEAHHRLGLARRDEPEKELELGARIAALGMPARKVEREAHRAA